ncbi:hypothetical protein tinsulaeT_32440 [Thalassotalea insulae]|uniref:OmpR/PhoB-type domain-containing protein n=1 Tax=Thalassotalea insulae TaxID=2056778 RepID=A0ABQ6GW48_9GAMM|nr:winged helix-turn-helix domain-containing protein [Thalassotalea insulae]GLX79904.1 hypothetical protein tinsulaeT_32440 [Thalassotalea insulae]
MHTPLIKFGPFVFDTQLEQISNADKVYRLEHQQAKLLNLLLEHRDKILSREQIADTIWQDVIVEDNTISKAITRLRKVLDDSAKSPRFIKTIPKKGYQFIADIEKINKPEPITPLTNEPDKRNHSNNANAIKSITVIAAVSFVIIIWLSTHTANEHSATPNKKTQVKATSVATQAQALTYREGIEYNAHLHPDGQQLLFNGSDKNGYGIFYKKINDADAKQLTKVNSRLSFPKWLPSKNHSFVYSELSAVQQKQQCQIISATLAPIDVAIKETQVIASCVSDKPVEVFVNYAENLLIWQDLSGVWQYQLTTKSRQQLPFALELGEYQVPSPDLTLWAALKQINDKSQLTVYRFDNQEVIYQKMLDYSITHFKWAANNQALYHLSEHPAHQLIAQAFDGQETVLSTSSIGSITQISDTQLADTLEYVISAIDIDVSYFHNGQTELIVNSTFPDYSPSFSSDLTQLAFASKRTGSAQIWLKQANGHYTQLTNFTRASYIYAVLWSPDNNQLLVKRNNSIYLINVSNKAIQELPINAEHKFAWQWISNHRIAFIDQQSHALFSFDTQDHNQQLLKTDVSYAQYTAQHWYLSDKENRELIRYNLNFKQGETMSTKLNGRFWRINAQTLYLFNQQPAALVKVEQDGKETAVISDRAISHLSVQNAGNQGFIFHQVSQNEANIYQLHLNE